MKQVRELSDCKAIVVLNPKGKHVATVHFRWGSGGGVQCDVYDEFQLVHQRKVGGGWGYDKEAAALSGAVIGGFRMADHCGSVEAAGMAAAARLMKAYMASEHRTNYQKAQEIFRPKADKIGFRFANWREGSGWGSLHPESGLDRLRAMGYTVIHAL